MFGGGDTIPWKRLVLRHVEKKQLCTISLVNQHPFKLCLIELSLFDEVVVTKKE